MQVNLSNIIFQTENFAGLVLYASQPALHNYFIY